MAGKWLIANDTGMASPWRRRQMCVLVSDHSAPACIRRVSAKSAFLETNARPPVDEAISVLHPGGGRIRGRVESHAPDGIRIQFELSADSARFALTSIAADMIQAPARSF